MTWLRPKATLSWILKHGEDAEYLEEIAEETGDIPQPLLDRPELPGHLRPTLEAFLLLNDSRPQGFGTIGGITTTDILAMAAEVEPNDTLRFLRVIRAMDGLVLADFAKRAEAASNST